MLFNTFGKQNEYDAVTREWQRLSPITSARALYNTTSAVLHPGCIFLVKKVQRDAPIVVDTGASVSY